MLYIALVITIAKINNKHEAHYRPEVELLVEEFPHERVARFEGHVVIGA